MSWFTRRPRRVILEHRLSEKQFARFLAALSESVRYAADAPERLFLAQQPPAPELKPVAPKSRREEVIDEWLAAMVGDEQKKSHARALVDVFLKKRPEEDEWTRSASIGWLLANGAPLGL